jgi:hypothetical protein
MGASRRPAKVPVQISTFSVHKKRTDTVAHDTVAHTVASPVGDSAEGVGSVRHGRSPQGTRFISFHFKSFVSGHDLEKKPSSCNAHKVM